MADQYDFSGRKISTNQNPFSYSPLAQNMANLSPLNFGYTPSFENISSGGSTMNDYLNNSVGFSSEESYQADSAKNANQKGAKESGGLMDLYSSLVDLLGGRGKQIDDSGAKWKLSATGSPYRVVNVSALDESGNRKARTELDLAGNPITTTGRIEENKIKIDRTNENPITFASPAQATEIERRKQLSMSANPLFKKYNGVM